MNRQGGERWGVLLVVMVVVGVSLCPTLTQGEDLTCPLRQRVPTDGRLCCPCMQQGQGPQEGPQRDLQCQGRCPSSGFFQSSLLQCAGVNESSVTTEPPVDSTTNSFTTSNSSDSDNSTIAPTTPTPPAVQCIACVQGCHRCNQTSCLQCLQGFQLRTHNETENVTCVAVPGSDDDELPLPLILGASVGGVVVVVLVVLAAVCYCRRRRRGGHQPEEEPGVGLVSGRGVNPPDVAPDVTKGGDGRGVRGKGVEEPVYANVQAASLPAESIRRGHDSVLRYTRDPTFKKEAAAAPALEDKELDALPEAPAPPTPRRSDPRQDEYVDVGTDTPQPPQDEYVDVDSRSLQPQPHKDEYVDVAAPVKKRVGTKLKPKPEPLPKPGAKPSLGPRDSYAEMGPPLSPTPTGKTLPATRGEGVGGGEGGGGGGGWKRGATTTAAHRNNKLPPAVSPKTTTTTTTTPNATKSRHHDKHRRNTDASFPGPAPSYGSGAAASSMPNLSSAARPPQQQPVSVKFPIEELEEEELAAKKKETHARAVRPPPDGEEDEAAAGDSDDPGQDYENEDVTASLVRPESGPESPLGLDNPALQADDDPEDVYRNEDADAAFDDELHPYGNEVPEEGSPTPGGSGGSHGHVDDANPYGNEVPDVGSPVGGGDHHHQDDPNPYGNEIPEDGSAEDGADDDDDDGGDNDYQNLPPALSRRS